MKKGLLALSLVSAVSLVACGAKKPDPKKTMEDVVKELFGADYVSMIEVDNSQGYDDYWIGLIFTPDDGESVSYFELLQEAFDEAKPLLEKKNFKVYAEPTDYPDYEQAFFEFYYTDNEDESKAKELVCFDGLTYPYEYEGDDCVVLQFECYDLSSFLA